ncbi:MAG: hypothetical protein DRJ30_04705 [Candidatus Methanomethylicota archaeon]|nr:MAG: hypothetical protein DRJ30_04705 [Candidatus Verstraetearchaeota archaeon]
MEDIALIATYLLAGAFPVAYNYAIARKLAKKYGVGKVCSPNGEIKEPLSRVELSNRENENEPSIFKIDSVSLTENGLVINLVISRDELVKLLSSNGS